VTRDYAQENRRRVTISDVAWALGVAVSMVSNAYHRPDQLSAELRRRVVEVAASADPGRKVGGNVRRPSADRERGRASAAV
jgi:hypothetical protein